MAFRIINDLFECQRFIASETGTLGSDIVVAFGLEKDNKLVAAVGFNNFLGQACSVHVCIKDRHSLTRDFIKHCVSYVFNIAMVQTVIATVELMNERVIRLARHFGFKDLAFVPGVDMMILTLNKNECKWVSHV